MENKKIILLNGASSSGKSTIAKALQAYIKDVKHEEYSVISIDDFLKMTIDEAIDEDDVFEISLKLCDKSIEMLAINQGVIIDHVITSKRIFNQLIETLKSYKVYLIHITCPLKELIRREDERRNRCIGSAEASYQYLFPKDGYDLTLDTFKLTPKECSSKIVDVIFNI
ncbi:AAA family ATPase [Sedimentibacter sp. zth1]|uniref:phosphotransferase-like protein n=1 Tax=Sedimentibacter sp. zth1 TaxID=2816908 RepID=UPI001A92194F|nr:AAA family ATPase [Sedimentibacter sp. zth1]QSX04661.1 AAA family ATPase [Sedimentibacter sp. zth1]